MYVPATPALPALPLPAVGIMAGEAAPSEAPPAATVLRVRRTQLNVLDGGVASVAGVLSAPRPIADDRAGAAGGPSLSAGARASVAGARVSLQARGRHGWLTLAVTRTGAQGRYRLRYRTKRIGSESLRVSFAGAPGASAAWRRVGRLNVYRLAEVSWYGGEGSLACGGRLTSSTLGVANKTLPCGTLVTLRYGERTLRVRVIDRGPYVEGREFDLTEATKRALGFEGVGEVWATS
jgi:rare lipoprotein A